MKLLIFSDLHLREESAEVCKAVLDGVLEDALHRGISHLAFLGDWWHVRYRVPIGLQNMVKNWLHTLYQSDLTLTLIPGNHDQINAGDFANALEVFDGYPNVKVYSQPTKDGWGIWIPYRKDPNEVSEFLDAYRMQGLPVFAHLPVAGAFMNNNILGTDGVPITMFRGFTHVFLGHYHKRQTFANGLARYVGSPYQTRADECGQKKGWGIWDAETKVFEYVDARYGKCYHRFELGDGQSGLHVDWGHVRSGDQVRILVPTQDDVAAMRQKLKMYANGNFDLLIEPERMDVAGPRFGLTKGTTLTEYAKAYVASQEVEGLTAKELMDAFEEILQCP